MQRIKIAVSLLAAVAVSLAMSNAAAQATPTCVHGDAIDAEALKAADAIDRPSMAAQLSASGVPALFYPASEDLRAQAALRFASATTASFL